MESYVCPFCRLLLLICRCSDTCLLCSCPFLAHACSHTGCHTWFHHPSVCIKLLFICFKMQKEFTFLTACACVCVRADKRSDAFQSWKRTLVPFDPVLSFAVNSGWQCARSIAFGIAARAGSSVSRWYVQQSLFEVAHVRVYTPAGLAGFILLLRCCIGRSPFIKFSSRFLLA